MKNASKGDLIQDVSQHVHRTVWAGPVHGTEDDAKVVVVTLSSHDVTIANLSTMGIIVI